MVEGQEVAQKYFRFPGAGLELEGILHLPGGDGPFSAVAVCHPHPLYGGDMQNSVVEAVCHALAAASTAAFRFNFRGVGLSQGEHAGGIGEREDLVAALAFLQSIDKVNPGSIGLVGYSFGTMVAVPVAFRDERVKALALVSPVLKDTEWEQLGSCAFPKLLVCGSEDEFISSREVQRMASGLLGPSKCQIIAGADHFWCDYEGEVAQRVASFIEAALSVPL